MTVAQSTADNEKLNWWGDIDGFINQQDKITLDMVVQALTKYPPSITEPLERKMAMLMLDAFYMKNKQHTGLQSKIFYEIE